MRTLRRLLLAAVLAAIALVAGGCFPLIQAVETSQPDVGGPVAITTTICQGNNTTNGGATPVGSVCDPAPGDAEATANNLVSAGNQFFAGYLVPAAATPVDAQSTGGVVETLAPHQGWADHLNATAPPPAGRKWVAFATGPLGASTSGLATVVARFTMPEGATAMPYEVRMGARDLVPTLPEAPIVPASLLGSNPIAGVATSGEAQLRDVSVLAGQAAPVEVRRGQTAAVPFVADYRGATASGLLPVTAATTLPGATAAPDVDPLQFASTGTRPVAARVAVPSGAPLGDHDVTLAIPLAGGGARSATAKLRVLADLPAAPPATPPAAVQPSSGGGKAAAAKPKLGAAAFRTTKRSAVLRDGLRFEQTLPGAGKVVWELRRGATRLARLSRTVTRAGKQTVTLKLTTAGKRAARRGRRAPVTLKTTFTPAGQAAVTATRNLTLRP